MTGRMTGHVFQRTWETKEGDERSSWAYAIERGRVDGRRLTPITRGPFKTKRDAQTALRDELTAREGGTYVAPSRQSVGEYLAEWTNGLADLRPNTRDLYERIVRLHLTPHIGDLPIQALRAKDVRDLFATLSTKGSPGGRGSLSPAALHNVRTTLHKAMKQAEAEGVVRRNVVALVPPPERSVVDDDEGEPEHWTAQQVAAFLDYVDTATVKGIVTERRSRRDKEYVYQRAVPAEPMLRAIFYLLAYSGVRRGEACGLRWRDVDLAKGTMTIRRARVMVAGDVKVSKPKTRRGRRMLGLHPNVVAALEEWRVAQFKERQDYGAAWEDHEGHVFTHSMRFSSPIRYGVAVRPDWVSGKFRQFAKGAGLPALRLHGLRHSVATAAIEAGEPLWSVSDMLGHADQSVTDRVYAHTIEYVTAAAAIRVGDRIASARGGGA
jgi:integrase